MARPEIRVRELSPVLQEGLDRIRAELRLPEGFAPEVDAAASDTAARVSPAGADRLDARDIPFVSIDPPASRDLDQAYFAERVGRGYRVRYAIADVAAFVSSSDPVDLEVRQRGMTLYLPDRRVPLHPEVLSEGAASLLPGDDRPALLWTIDLDAGAMATDMRLERATVRNREATTYHAVTQAVESGQAAEPLELLREIGELRIEREAERNGVSISVPTQEVVPHDSGYRLEYDVPVAAERWNAQVSLLAGMCAAEIMVDGGVGILRTLPPPDQQVVARLRVTANTLGIPWPEGAGYDDVVRGLDPTPPAHAAFLTQAVQVLRGSGYEMIGTGEPVPMHSAVAAPYAHVTAPLRRLVDRFANEIVLARCADAAVPSWATDALPDLPAAMSEAAQRASSVEHAVVDLIESVLLADQVGEVFDATIVDVGNDHAEALLREPAVIAPVDGRGRELGEAVRLRLRAAEPTTRRVEFEVEP